MTGAVHSHSPPTAVSCALRSSVDALGWRRVLSNRTAIQPPDARLSRGLEVHPAGTSEDMELWIDPPLRARRLQLVLSPPMASFGSASGLL